MKKKKIVEGVVSNYEFSTFRIVMVKNWGSGSIKELTELFMNLSFQIKSIKGWEDIQLNF